MVQPDPLNVGLESIFDFIISQYQKENRAIKFVQIGAYDGVANDPIRNYIEKYEWEGILVEPQKEYFSELEKYYKNINNIILVNAAVSSQNGIKKFYSIKKGISGLPKWAYQIASFNLDSILRHEHLIPNLKDIIVEDYINCITFEKLLDDANFKKIDLLQIDTEGFDFEIIKSINFNQVKPFIIHYEHKFLIEDELLECWRYLMLNGYLFAVEKNDTTAYLGEYRDM